MSFNEQLGMFGIILTIILAVVGIWFGIITAMYIATAVGAIGVDWWIVMITIFGTLGGSCIHLVRD